LQLDDKGQEKFVARVIKNREDSNKQGLNNLDELKLKYKNKEIGVE